MEDVDLSPSSPADEAWSSALREQDDDVRAVWILKEIHKQLDPVTRTFRFDTETGLTAGQCRRVKRYLSLRLQHVHLSALVTASPCEGEPDLYIMHIDVEPPSDGNHINFTGKVVLAVILVAVGIAAIYVLWNL